MTPTPGRARRWSIAVVAMAVGVLGVGAIMPVYATQGDVEYLLTWDTTGVEWGADGSWTTTTDLGYTVTVADGTLTTFSATMVACDHDHGLFGWLLGLVGPAVAEAGHSTEGEAALVGGPMVEDLTDLSTISLGSTTVDEPAYCEGHTAWGSGDADLPTLTLTGTWTGPDGTTGILDLSTTIDWGFAGSLQGESGPVHIEVGAAAVVEIQRSIGVALDGIDFATVDETEVAMGVLRSIATDSKFLVVEGVAHA